ncbi:MAG: hypothetical protein LC803_19605 [Acidobacteria bacterium]|nr:hypothetical protein [Acidobacteriota bacterium]
MLTPGRGTAAAGMRQVKTARKSLNARRGLRFVVFTADGAHATEAEAFE